MGWVGGSDGAGTRAGKAGTLCCAPRPRISPAQRSPLGRPSHSHPLNRQVHMSYVRFEGYGYYQFAAFAKGWLQARKPVLTVAYLPESDDIDYDHGAPAGWHGMGAHHALGGMGRVQCRSKPASTRRRHWRPRRLCRCRPSHHAACLTLRLPRRLLLGPQWSRSLASAPPPPSPTTQQTCSISIRMWSRRSEPAGGCGAHLRCRLRRGGVAGLLPARQRASAAAWPHARALQHAHPPAALTHPHTHPLPWH